MPKIHYPERLPRNRISMLRKIAGLSPEDIAERMNVVKVTVERWEAGAVQIPDHQKLALADLFGVSPAFLMGWPEGNGEDRSAA